MFNFFRPKSDDSELNLNIAAMAHFLVDDKGADTETPLKKYLAFDKLDYSQESLKYVDEYLEEVRKNKKDLSDTQIATIVLRCGGYCGEVIKRNSKKSFTWVTYEDAVRIDKRIKDFGPEKNIYVFSVLLEKPSSFSFPFAKIPKYIENGREDSLYFFAQVIANK